MSSDSPPDKKSYISSDLPFIVPNKKAEGRNSDAKYFCCLCEQYIKTKEHALDHSKLFVHQTYIWVCVKQRLSSITFLETRG